MRLVFFSIYDKLSYPVFLGLITDPVDLRSGMTHVDCYDIKKNKYFI